MQKCATKCVSGHPVDEFSMSDSFYGCFIGLSVTWLSKKSFVAIELKSTIKSFLITKKVLFRFSAKAVLQFLLLSLFIVSLKKICAIAILMLSRPSAQDCWIFRSSVRATSYGEMGSVDHKQDDRQIEK